MWFWDHFVCNVIPAVIVLSVNWYRWIKCSDLSYSTKDIVLAFHEKLENFKKLLKFWLKSNSPIKFYYWCDSFIVYGGYFEIIHNKEEIDAGVKEADHFHCIRFFQICMCCVGFQVGIVICFYHFTVVFQMNAGPCLIMLWRVCSTRTIRIWCITICANISLGLMTVCRIRCLTTTLNHLKNINA